MRQCKHPTCGNVCRRLKKKKKIYTLHRTPIRRLGKKGKQLLGERKLQSAKDKEFYAEIWDERNHVCYETNIYLGGEALLTFFHHVLPKGTRIYKKYRYRKWNVILVSLETHSKAETNIDFVPTIKAYRDFLLEHLDEFKKLP